MALIAAVERIVYSNPHITDVCGYKYEKLVYDTVTRTLRSYRIDRKKAKAIIRDQLLRCAVWKCSYRRWEPQHFSFAELCKSREYLRSKKDMY